MIDIPQVKGAILQSSGDNTLWVVVIGGTPGNVVKPLVHHRSATETPRRDATKQIAPRVCGDARDGFQLQALAFAVEVEVPELQLGLVRELGIHCPGPRS